MWKTLQAFGFSSEFVSYIKVLYCDIESVLKVNGGLCAPYKMGRGIRQGCSFSGRLYTIVIEPFLNTLRKSLEGVSLQSAKTFPCLSAYADDIIVLVSKQMILV